DGRAAARPGLPRRAPPDRGEQGRGLCRRRRTREAARAARRRDRAPARLPAADVARGRPDAGRHLAEILMTTAETPHKHHFRLAYGVLALAFWVSVGGLVLLLSRPNHSASVAWSSWQPDTQGLAGAREIALTVSSRYMLSNGTQLVAVQEHSPQVQGLKLEAVGIRRLN